MTALVRYEQARTALAECHRVDEVKEIRDKAAAMAAYARQAKDSDLIQWATEIKVRAERKAGIMLTQASEAGDMAKRGRPPVENKPVTLSDLGLNDVQAARWKSLGSMSEEHFETAVATAKDTAGQVTTAFMLREAAKVKPHKRRTKRDEERLHELEEAKARGVSMLTTYARLTITALRSAKSITEDENRVLDELAELIQKVVVN